MHDEYDVGTTQKNKKYEELQGFSRSLYSRSSRLSTFGLVVLVRASPMGRCIFMSVCVAHEHKKCPHASAPSPAAETHLYDRKGLPCMIREEREAKIHFLWLGMASTWSYPALKEEREGAMQPNRMQTDTRTCSHRRIPDVYLIHVCVRTDTADILRLAAGFFCRASSVCVARLEMP
jgi:hypothetical protein